MTKQPTQINLSFDANVRKHVAIVPIGWSAKKNEQQAVATIAELLNKDGTPYSPSPEMSEFITVMFNPDRNTKMKVLRDKLKKEGADLDPTSEAFLDLLSDEQQFRIFLGTIQDPKTGKTLVEKKHRANRKKLLQAAFSAKPEESEVDDVASTTPVSDESSDADENESEPAQVQPPQGETKKSATRK